VKILVRAPNWIGDQVLAYPFYVALRRKFPDAKIVSACVPWVGALQFRNQVDQVSVLTPGAETSGVWGAIRHLRDQGQRLLAEHGPFDLAYALPNSFSSAFLLWNSRARSRVGYGMEERSLLLTEPRNWKRYGAPVHRARAYWNLIASLDGPPQERVSTESGVFAWANPFLAESEWPDSKPISPPAEPYWVLAPGATADSRRWDLASFLALARRVTDALGARGVIVGGAKEAPLADRLREDRSLELIDLTARGTVADLWKVFRHTKLTVCNESGLAHVASLLGSPVQIICGAADPRRTRPMGPGPVQVSFNPIDCWPCEKNHCYRPPGEEYLCLKGIAPERVWEEIDRGFRFTDPD
jgi:lipopolysaccharide heptosyltransferase II